MLSDPKGPGQKCEKVRVEQGEGEREKEYIREQNLLDIDKQWQQSQVAQSCPTLWDPVDCSPPGSSIHGIHQARILEWLPFPSPGDLPNPGIEPRSPTLQADALTSELPGKNRKKGSKMAVAKIQGRENLLK